MEVGVITCIKHPTQAIKRESHAVGLTFVPVFYCPRCHVNRSRRSKNAVLRELCGTSARAAREDMGLSKR